MSVVDEPVQLDPDKLNQFVFRAVEEVGAALNAALVVMGDKLGLYRALAGAGPLSAVELARRAGVSERYVREWLNAQAAGGFVDYDPASGRYTLPPEQTMALTDEQSPAYLPGLFQTAVGSIIDSPRITESARTGAGVGWHEHNHDVFDGCERFFRPGYNANLITAWLPALDGVVEKLEAGARSPTSAAGTAPRRSSWRRRTRTRRSSATTTTRARSRPPASARRRRASRTACAFETTTRRATRRRRLRPRDDVRLPARHGRPGRRGQPRSRAPQGRRDVDDRRADGRRPRSRTTSTRSAATYYGFSTFLCTPASLSQEVGLALGAQAGEARIGDVVRRRRVLPLPPGRRDAVQPGVRGAAIALWGLRSTAWAGATPRRRRASPTRVGSSNGMASGCSGSRTARARGRSCCCPRGRSSIRATGRRRSRTWRANSGSLRFDGRGNGLSDRPTSPSAYHEREFIADAVAVLDATGVRSACVAGLSMGGLRALVLAAEHPDRVSGACAIAPSVPVPLVPDPPGWQTGFDFEAERERYVGLGEVQPPLLALGLPRVPRVLLLRVPVRAPLDQADRGPDRLGSRRRSRGVDPDVRWARHDIAKPRRV